MGLLTKIVRPNGLIHGRPLFFFSSLVDMVPMVANLVSSPRVLGKRALVLKIQTFLLQAKLPSAMSLWNNWPSVNKPWPSPTKSIKMWIGAPIRCSP
jgi:hypothetical protein